MGTWGNSFVAGRGTEHILTQQVCGAARATPCRIQSSCAEPDGCRGTPRLASDHLTRDGDGRSGRHSSLRPMRQAESRRNNERANGRPCYSVRETSTRSRPCDTILYPSGHGFSPYRTSSLRVLGATRSEDRDAALAFSTSDNGRRDADLSGKWKSQKEMSRLSPAARRGRGATGAGHAPWRDTRR